MLTKCGLQYEFRYVRGIKRPPGVALVIGKGAHGAIEADLGKKIETGELLADDAIADYARDATEAEWKKETPKPEDDGEPADLGGAVDMAIALAELHHREVAPGLEPIAVERGFTLAMPDFPFDFTGYIDVEEKGRVRDVKTAGKAPASDAADTSEQLTAYSLEATVRGAPAAEVVLDVLVKTKVPRVVTLRSERTADDHRRFLRKLEMAARVIKAGAFLPAPKVPGVWWCSQKHCGYWDMCPAGRRQSVQVGLIDPARLVSRLAERRP
jgi:hypothetical protein